MREACRELLDVGDQIADVLERNGMSPSRAQNVSQVIRRKVLGLSLALAEAGTLASHAHEAIKASGVNANAVLGEKY